MKAFCGEECRGIGQIIGNQIMINAYGTPKDNISFKVTVKGGTNDISLPVTIPFEEKPVGTLAEPLTIMVDKSKATLTDIFADNSSMFIAEDGLLTIDNVDPGAVDFIGVYDSAGSCIIYNDWKCRDQKVTMDVSQLQAGVYLVVVTPMNGAPISGKIVIR